VATVSARRHQWPRSPRWETCGERGFNSHGALSRRSTAAPAGRQRGRRRRGYLRHTSQDRSRSAAYFWLFPLASKHVLLYPLPIPSATGAQLMNLPDLSARMGPARQTLPRIARGRKAMAVAAPSPSPGGAEGIPRCHWPGCVRARSRARRAVEGPVAVAASEGGVTVTVANSRMVGALL